jgi:hypothetical protein
MKLRDLNSHWIEADRMEPTKPAKIVLVIVALVTCSAWALLLWIASVVTDTMLRVLQYVVELAQMS